MRIFVIAGETSGDTHAAALLADLRTLCPDLAISGLGGPKLHALAPGIEDWIHDAAVVGLWDVLRRYGWFRGKFREALDQIDRSKPDAVLFVDYPGFNLRLAKALQSQRPRVKLLYYISPQVWAWNRARIPRMARWLDHMFCIFPFEKDLYEKSGLATEFVGHPMAAHLESGGDASRDPDLLALLPGSREREVRKIFPVMLDAAKLVLALRPRTVFASAASSEKLQAVMRGMAAEAGVGCEIGLRNARDLMLAAAAGLVASGTATLEATLCGLPYALVYRVAPISYVTARAVIRVPYLGMANLLAGREIVKEFIQRNATAERLAPEAVRLLDNDAARESMRRDFASVRNKLVAPASITPAGAVLAALAPGS